MTKAHDDGDLSHAEEPKRLPEGSQADLEAELASLRSALEEKTAQHLRLAADFENFRRRTAQEMLEMSRYASETAVSTLLPVVDNLRRAVDHAAAGTDASLLDGVRMTLRQFDEALASLGVTPIPTVGERFDPAIHEAVLAEESDQVEHDTVVAELQRGYRLHDRVLRPALVKVAHPARASAAATEDSSFQET